MLAAVFIPLSFLVLLRHPGLQKALVETALLETPGTVGNFLVFDFACLSKERD